MSGVNIKHSKQSIEWAEEVIQENEVVNKDSEIINSLIGECPIKDLNLAIARLVIQESKK